MLLLCRFCIIWISFVCGRVSELQDVCVMCEWVYKDREWLLLCGCIEAEFICARVLIRHEIQDQSFERWI